MAEFIKAIKQRGFFMLKKRLGILLAVITACFTLLLLRALYLQVFDSAYLSKAASSQRVTSSSVEKPRGGIVDRNSIPFTSREKKYTIVLKPLYLRSSIVDISRICGVLGLDTAKTIADINVKREPILVETDEVKKNLLMAMNIKGLSVVYSLKRYDSDSLAKHVIGYLNKVDQVGQAGMEKFFEQQLHENAVCTVGVVTDARYNLVEGLGYRINQTDIAEKFNIKLTLDYHIQKIVEDVMSRKGITGAVVVEDVNNGDIVAIASKPDFDQNSVGNYLDGSKNELFNRATAAYNIGSVFKIIDAAALLESGGYAPESYICTGSIKEGKKEFKCSSYSNGGHGEVNFEKAFAQSCNPYFIDLGIRVGYRKLIETASEFGLGSYTGLKDQGVAEYKGNLPQLDRNYSNGDIANISIGQGEIMATPLQIADIAATIANGGIKNRINIVDSIIDGSGNTVRELRIKSGKRIISVETAAHIRRLMEAVTEYGTGQAARLQEYGGGAGKTGSAETGSKDVVHAWFAGYFPRSQPKYSIAVFVENGQYGGKVAAPVFADIAAEIMKKGF